MVVDGGEVEADVEVFIVGVDVDKAVKDAVVDLPVVLCWLVRESKSNMQALVRTDLILLL